MNAQLPPPSAPVPHDGDLYGYNTRLAAGMEEKLWFLDRLPSEVSVFADFGCADGAVLRSLVKMRGGWPIGIGYDHDPEQVKVAQGVGGPADWEFTDSAAMFAARLNRHHRQGAKSCLILSSVLHEVLSQGTNWRQFWVYVQSLGCDYIAIRDMAVTEECKKAPINPATWDIRGMLTSDFAIYRTFKEMVSMSTRSDFLQLLLKARYPHNLEREAKEDYFAVTVEQLLNMTTIGSGYKLRHFDHHTLPFLVDEWRKKYGVTVSDPTHVKLLLQKAR